MVIPFAKNGLAAQRANLKSRHTTKGWLIVAERLSTAKE